MARTRGAYPFSGSLEIHRTSPLDARLLVPTLAELTLEETWSDGGGIWLYNHIVVTVEDVEGQYMLTNYNPVSAPDAYKTAENWIRVDAGGATLEVVDNLTSTDNTKALAASQGKALADKIEEVKNSVAAVYKYKGSVTSVDTLPTENVTVGDVYNVAVDDEHSDGMNYVWTGTEWDALGATVDLSGYYTKDQTDNAISEAVSGVTTELNTLKDSVSANTDAINIINGVEGTKGSLANTLKLSKDYTDSQLTNYVAKEEGKTLISEEQLTQITTIDNRVTALETATEDLVALKATVRSNSEALTVLNGDAETEGSVINIVNTSINEALSWVNIE